MKNNFNNIKDYKAENLKNQGKSMDERMKSQLDDILNEGKDLAKEKKKTTADNCKNK